ncbi:glycosyltransferase [Halobellus rubicundus]|uniref:Glycosyltransferase family 2 protein n=1 Tax=Halobellus rubicundus TaxID=2996466 RepID=A0ABD5MA50_9EURY
MVTYSIAICNYNMGETIEESLRSILNAVDDRFEVVVVDGGSTDDSIDILRKINQEYECLRFISLPQSKTRKLGRDRDISIRYSNGKYVLLHIDCDDKYDERIVDLAEAYKQMDEKIDFRFGLTGGHVTIARRDFLLDIGSYRNISAAEDLDLWRRMMAVDGYINLKCEVLYNKIGYNKSYAELLKRILDMRVSEFQTGMSYRSFVRTRISEKTIYKTLIAIAIATIAYPIAMTKPSFKKPSGGFHRYEKYMRYRSKHTRAPEEIEKKYNIDIDWGNIKEDSQD